LGGLTLLFVAGLLLGAASGLLFARWRAARSARREGSARVWQVIAVPVVDGALPATALSAAVRLSKASGSHVVVLVVVKVPRTLSLSAEQAPGIDAALTQLEAAERLLRSQGVSGHGEIVRAREVGDRLVRACAELGVGAVVLEAGGTSRSASDLLRTFLDETGSRRFDVIVTHPQTGEAQRAIG